jgi:hypothetical protein
MSEGERMERVGRALPGGGGALMMTLLRREGVELAVSRIEELGK